jgi:hypothetical protein
MIRHKHLLETVIASVVTRPLGVCEDVAMPLFPAFVGLLVRRVRPVTVALAAYEMWRRLPPEQRQKLMQAARRNGPRIASSLARRARPRILR